MCNLLDLFIACEQNSHVNKLKGWMSSDQPDEWNFDRITRGPWNKWDFQAGYNSGKAITTMPSCMQSASWYGWNYPGDSSISTILHGNGKAILEFGNCNSGGTVVASINDEEILRAESSLTYFINKIWESDFAEVKTHYTYIQGTPGC